MAGRYTDAERLARGQYKVNGQWYTSSGYKIRNANEGADSLSGDYSAYESAAGQERTQDSGKSSTHGTDSAAIGLLQSQKQQAALDTERALRQAYISHVKALRDIEQQLTAAGYSGGMTDSAYLALNADYENRRGDILAEGEKTAADYDTQILAKRIAAEEEAAAESTARTGIGTAKTSTAKTSTAKTTTAKTAAAKTGSTKTQTASNAKSSGASYSDLQKAYVNQKSQEVTNAMLAGRLTQGQARVQKNLLKKMMGK